MEFNLLKPARAVHQSYLKPDLAVSLLIVLFPAIVSIVGTIVFAVSLNLLAVFISAVSSIVNWIAMGVLLYVIGYVFEGKYLKGKFSGILSALSLVWLILTIMAIIGFLIVTALPSGIVTTTNAMDEGKIGAEQASMQLATILDSAAAGTNILLLGVFTVVSLALIVFALLIIFLISREFSPKSIGKQIAITLIFIIAWVFISGIITSVFSKIS